MTSEVAARLEAKGLVMRRPDARDGRATLIQPAAEGADLARRAIAVVESVDHEFIASVDQGNLVSTLQALTEIDVRG